MNKIIELKCKNCGSLDFEQKSRDIYFCKHCGGTLLIDNNQNYEITLRKEQQKFKQILLKCANILTNDIDTPTDILDLKIISIKEQYIDKICYQCFSFEYNSEQFYLVLDSCGVYKKELPIAKRELPSLDFPIKIKNLLTILILVLLAIFLLPIFVIALILIVYDAIKKRNNIINSIYEKEKKIKEEKLKEFIKKNNLEQ